MSGYARLYWFSVHVAAIAFGIYGGVRLRLGELAGAVPARDHDPGMPARSAPAARRRDRLDVEAAPGEQPGRHRVGVPHLARAELVAAPDRSRHGRHEVEKPPGDPGSSLNRCGPPTASTRSGITPSGQRRTWSRKMRKRPAQRLPTAPSATTPRAAPFASGIGAISIT